MTPLATVQAFLAAAERKDFDAAMHYVTETCEYTNLPMGTVHGPAGIRQVLEPFFGPIKENQFRLLRVAADGHLVFVERLDRHHSEHGWWELPVTGVFEVHDGKISVWREYFDMATMQKGMGGGTQGAAA